MSRYQISAEEFGLKFPLLVEQVMAGGWEDDWFARDAVTGFEARDQGGRLVPIHIRILAGTAPVANPDRARARAWGLLMEADVELPRDAVGTLLSSLNVAALLFVALPAILPGIGPAILKALQSAGLAPDLPDLGKDVAREVAMVLFKKWGALGATLLAIIAAVLTLFGQGEAAKVAGSIADMIGVDSSIIGGASAGVLVLAVAAVGKRLYSLGQKAFGPLPPGAPTGAAAKLLWRFGGLIGTVGTIAVVVLGAFAQPEMAGHVNGLLALFGGQDAAVAGALATIVPAVVSLLAYARAKLKPATT